MTEGNPTVEEAREDVIGALGELFMQIQRGGYRGQQVPVLPEVYLTTVDALIEAVRQEERERLGACLECGGGGVGLVRAGNAYEHFDQGDYTIVDCDACAGTGRVERGEV